MAKERRNWIDRHFGNDVLATCLSASGIRLVVLSGILCVAAPAIHAEASDAGKGISRRVDLEGPGDTGAMPCEVVQVLDANGDPTEYFMDVDSVVCADAKCAIVTVRIYFDPLGSYLRYKLPSGGNLTKLGHKPFSRADHQKLHQVLSDPYSQLQSFKLDEITVPKGSPGGAEDVDGISGATVLSKRKMVVAGAAYTCLTLWHWSHGDVVNVIRDMTIGASDKHDLIRYLNSGQHKYVVFAADQLRTQNLFDAECTAAVMHVVRHGGERSADSAFRYLAKASIEAGVGHFFRCAEDECLVENSLKRVKFLDALRKTTQRLPSGYLERLSGWLGRADSYYEVHLLLSLLERENVTSEEAIRGAMLQLESNNALVVRRSYRWLKAQELNDAQRKELAVSRHRLP